MCLLRIIFSSSVWAPSRPLERMVGGYCSSSPMKRLRSVNSSPKEKHKWATFICVLVVRVEVSLLTFILKILFDYGIIPSQLGLNSWRILRSFFLGCMINRVMLTSQLFKRLYSLKSQKDFYFFQSKGTPLMINFPKSNKGWKMHFISIVNSNSFGINLEWRVVKANRNRVFGVMPDNGKISRKYWVSSSLESWWRTHKSWG